jgi:hypothetical protein
MLSSSFSFILNKKVDIQQYIGEETHIPNVSVFIEDVMFKLICVIIHIPQCELKKKNSYPPIC